LSHFSYGHINLTRTICFIICCKCVQNKTERTLELSGGTERYHGIGMIMVDEYIVNH